MKASSGIKLVLAISGALAIGILLGSTMFAGVLSGQASGTAKQGLTISGTETLKVLGPDGQVVSVWQGPDPLTFDGMNGIASCVTGSNGGVLTPDAFYTCNTWISNIGIAFDKPSVTCTYAAEFTNCTQLQSAATNYLTPQGCYDTTPYREGSTLCSGWQTQATFGPNSFTVADCGTTCHVEMVRTLGGTGGGAVFDELCTTSFGASDTFQGVKCSLGGGAIPALSPGDTLLVTIAFTVS